MKPHAYQSKWNSRQLMIPMALLTGGFVAWEMDLVPDFLSPQPDLRTSEAEGDNQDLIAPLWDEIVDHGETGSFTGMGSVDQSDDDNAGSGNLALQNAIAGQTEEFTFDSPDNAASEPVVHASFSTASAPATTDSQIRPATLETSTSTNKRAQYARQSLSPELAALLRQTDSWVQEGLILEAHAELSRVYWKHPEYRHVIRERIESTAGRIYASPQPRFKEHFVDFGDTLQAIAQQYEVPWQYLAKLNRINPQNLQAGQKLKVLQGPFSAVVDLSDFEITIHAHGWFVHRYAIGIGKDNRTPVGEFTVESKLTNPTWFNPDGGQVDADDPENPLGEYWLGIGDHIGIHGTIEPESIGTARSRGCIHLAEPDIGEVFDLLGIGSKVLIRE